MHLPDFCYLCFLDFDFCMKRAHSLIITLPLAVGCTWAPLYINPKAFNFNL
jgi:hypothetical protein